MIVPEPKDLVKDELFLSWFYQTSDSVFICRNTDKEILLAAYNQPAEKWVDEFFMHGKDGFVCKENEFERTCKNAFKTQRKVSFSFSLEDKGILTVSCSPVYVEEMKEWIVLVVGKNKQSLIGSYNASLLTYLSNTEDAVLVRDVNGTITFVNIAFTDMFGWKSEEVLGKKVFEINILPVSLIEESSRINEMSLRGSSYSHITTQRLRRDGKLFDVSITYSYVTDVDGEIVGSLSVFRDMSEQKKIESLLRESEERYRKLVDLCPLPIFVHQEGKVQYINHAALTLMGTNDESKLIGKSIYSFANMEHHAEIKKRSTEVHQEPVQGISEYTIKTLDHQYKIIEAMVTSISIRDNKVNLVLLNDITEKKKQEEALRESEKRYRLIADNSYDLISIIDRNGVGKYISPSHQRLLGYKESELIGDTATMRIHPNDREHTYATFQKVLETKEQQRMEYRMYRKNGSIIWIESILRMFDEGDQSDILIESRDITERKENEKMIRRLDKLSVVGQLAAGVAHEIRNPLTSIKGFLQLYQEQNLEKKDDHYWKIIFSELNRIEEIINEFMVLAKPQEVDHNNIPIKDLLSHTIVLFQSEAHLNNIEIDVSYVGTEEISIYAVENQLKQVFINLLRNAIEAIKPKTGKIRIKVESGYGEESVRFRFIDNGPGIPKDRLAHLGTPFYTTKEKGIGLGLTISQKIIHEHKGDFRIRSGHNRGTLIDIVLPRYN
ncbi:PAS domain S-box protein [Alkalihalophilus marmarensis]|uniref:PAS domain S-box protein n=1 Tax=Alkalihalophilus marmarensis TaxID=521377 RepID=UPI002DBE14C6|nr:PAS domain S-box protein [Alkalihalophilus marmarensis]MEC2071912.1 PAS domain S-box protein [Alkalihalophilus marmarensis]